MSRHEELRRLALAWNEAWNSRDPARLAGFFAPGSSFCEPNLPAAVDGAEGVTASATRTWSEWPHTVFEPISITVDEQRVVIEWRTTLSHKTGLAHVLEGVDILEFEGNLVASCRSYYDTRTRAPSRKR